MKKRLSYISDADFDCFLHFAGTRPEITKRAHLLQKLTIFNFVAPVVERLAPKEILEIGCGLGFHSALLTNYGHVTATELQVPGSFVAGDMDIANGREVVFAELAKSKVVFQVNDGHHLPFPDNSFDLIFHNSVIEHVPDAEKFNCETARLLKPNGFVICITGTPALCRFRLIRDFLLRLPFILVASFLKETGVASSKGIASRLAALVPLGTKSPARLNGISTWYARLKHYVYSPDYNSVVLDELAKSAGGDRGEVLMSAYEHFRGSVWNRLQFYLTAQTHGQHYRNVWHEMSEWKIGRWRETFTSAGFDVVEVIPYRFHHLFEATWSDKVNSAMYHGAAPFIERLGSAIPASFASEFILVAKKR